MGDRRLQMLINVYRYPILAQIFSPARRYVLVYMQHLLLVTSWESSIFNVLRVVWIPGYSINYHSVYSKYGNKLLITTHLLSDYYLFIESEWEIISVHEYMRSLQQDYAR